MSGSHASQPLACPAELSAQAQNVANVIGWLSAATLLATVAAQIVKQHRVRSIKGVSPWLYVGQATASSGLLVYSVLTQAWVFVVLNVAMALAAVYGLALWLRI